MNDDTLIVVSGYAGDAHQMEELLPYYEHHQRPLLVLSPDDSPIPTLGSHVGVSAGKRAYIGQASLDRQPRHLLTALELPYEWYLFNDSDSICISPEIPSYLYEDPDVIWSNEVEDEREKGCHDPLPHIAMQPPYFMSRKILRELVIHGAQTADPITPFIDWYMVQIAYAAGVPHRNFRDGVCFSTLAEEHVQLMEGLVRGGAKMLHSIKSGEVAARMKEAYETTT